MNWRRVWLALCVLQLSPLHAQEKVDPQPQQTSSKSAASGTEDAADPASEADSEAPPATIPVEPLPATPPQPAQDGQATQLDDIVVTAQKRWQSLQEIPIAVTAIRDTDIKESHIQSLSDLSNRLSGFHFGEVAGGGQASIRGVGFSLVTGAGEGSVAIHSDGLFLSRPGASTMLQEDLSRIEVLRGPQGTLYGRNATAGVVNLSTPEPPERFDAGAGVLGGDVGHRKYAFHIGDGFLDGALKFRLSGVTDENGDFFINEQFPGVDQGASDQASFRLAGDLLATDTLKFQLRTFSGDQEFNGPLYAAYKPPPDSSLAPPGTYSDEPYKIRINRAGASSKILRGGSLKALWDLSDRLALSSQSGYVNYQFDSPPGSAYDGDGTSKDTFAVTRFNPSETITEELNLNWESPGWQWIAGAFYLAERITLNFDVDASVSGISGVVAASLFPGVDPGVIAQASGQDQKLDILNYSSEKTTSWAVFGDTTYSILEDLRAFGGLRYLQDRKTQILTSRIFPRDSPDTGQTSCENLLTTFDADNVTGRLGLQYDVFSDAMSYLQYSTGYKSGGFSVAACGDTFKPEEVKSYEIGIKSTWLDRRLRANGAVFMYDYTNLQVEEVVLPSVIVNNAQAEVKGAEMELSAIPFQTFDVELGVNATFLDALYTDFVNSDNTESETGGPERQLAGNYLNRSPKYAVALSGQYSVALGRWGALAWRTEGNYKTRYYLREFNNDTDFQEAHWIVNSYLNYFTPGESFAVRGFVKNATDEPVLGGFLGVAGYKGAIFNPPRTIGVELNYYFQ